MTPCPLHLDETAQERACAHNRERARQEWAALREAHVDAYDAYEASLGNETGDEDDEVSGN